MTNYSNVPENKIARIGRRTYIESSINFANNHVTLDKRKHKKLYDNELLSCCDPDSSHIDEQSEYTRDGDAPMTDAQMRDVDATNAYYESLRKSSLDNCAQCGLTVAGSYTGRDDLLCEYHASE